MKEALAPSRTTYRFPVLLLWIVLHHAAVTTTTALMVVPPRALVVTSRTRDAGRHYHLMMAENDDDASSFILEKEYELTEQMVTERAEIEELLMANSVTSPLLPNEPTAAAAAAAVKPQRGFGGGSTAVKKKKKGKKLKNSKKTEQPPQNNSNNNKSDEAKDHAKVLKQEGLVRIDGVLSDAVTDQLREFVYDIRTTELKRGGATTMQATFSTIRRWDLSIPLFEDDSDDNNNNVVATTTTSTPSTPTIAYQALNDVLQTTAVGETMSRFLGTDNAELYELSSYISDPGSARQVIHADTPCFGTDDDQPILCTCFIALQDVRMDMGPTIWLPRTNTYKIHDLFFGEEDDETNTSSATPRKDQFLQTQSSVVGIIPKGSCVLFDSRLLHCGTANKSTMTDNSRALLFFSFQHPNINLFNPGGDTASIRPDLKGRFRLADFLVSSSRADDDEQ